MTVLPSSQPAGSPEADNSSLSRLDAQVAKLRAENKNLRAENAKLRAAVEQLEISVGVRGAGW